MAKDTPDMWVKLTADKTFFPPGIHGLCIDYRDGCEYGLRRIWGEALVAEGVAIEIPAPGRPAAKSSAGKPDGSDT